MKEVDEAEEATKEEDTTELNEAADATNEAADATNESANEEQPETVEDPVASTPKIEDK
jgi:hypothetical protein